MDRKSIMRALVLGAIIATGGIALFLFMYLVVLTELEPLMRLLGAFFAPIVAIVLFMGVLYFFRKRD